MSNRANGNRFEREMAALLHEHGFWVHLLTQNKAGQPADLIAAKGTYHTLIDCKVVSGNAFPFARAEENQRLAMERFLQKCEEPCWFALKLPGGSLRMLCDTMLRLLERRGVKKLGMPDMDSFTLSFGDWLEYVKLEEEHENNHRKQNHHRRPDRYAETMGAGQSHPAEPGLPEEGTDGLLDRENATKPDAV